MTDVENYYALIRNLEISDFQITIYSKHPSDRKELVREQEKNTVLLQNLKDAQNKLSKQCDNIDNIRSAFIYVADDILKSLHLIKKRGIYYPDLDQGMVIKGYLFGKILDAFKIALRFEGGRPITQIYMSQEEWDYMPLELLIQHIHDDLMMVSFASKMDAINYYENIKGLIIKLLMSLRAEGII